VPSIVTLNVKVECPGSFDTRLGCQLVDVTESLLISFDVRMANVSNCRGLCLCSYLASRYAVQVGFSGRLWSCVNGFLFMRRQENSETVCRGRP